MRLNGGNADHFLTANGFATRIGFIFAIDGRHRFANVFTGKITHDFAACVIQ
ncbi:Uncharacterised protein [Vibrio cholerae]|nr:Uncharacterised protein [Vibrio cholerae]